MNYSSELDVKVMNITHETCLYAMLENKEIPYIPLNKHAKI
jgi:hypothetical protein